MKRMSQSVAGSCLCVLLLVCSCGDDAKAPDKDTGPSLDQSQNNVEASVDQPTVPAEAGADTTQPSDVGPSPDKPKQTDIPQQVDLPKGDLGKADMKKVDMKKLDGGGKKDILRPDGLPPLPSNAACSSPKVLNMSTGKATETGDTSSSIDEYPGVTCGNSAALSGWDGPQLYYKVSLSGGRKYTATLKPGVDLSLYAFPASAGCSEGAINAGCTDPTPADPDRIYSSDNWGSSAAEELRIAPVSDQDWIIVVDAFSATTKGSFTLTVEEFIPATNGTCATATVLSPTGTPPSVTVQGDTSRVADEFGTTVDCGGSDLDGPQVYYKITIPNGKGYTFTLTPTFSAYMYVFPASANCVGTAVQTECSSGGATGAVTSVTSGKTKSLTFLPSTGGTYIVGIDSTSLSYSGSFTLTATEVTPPTNAVCSGAKTLTLAGSPPKVTENGNTAAASNEFGANIKCGKSFALDGNQVYYKFAVASGKTYRLTLQPTFSAYMYAFPDSAACAATAIDTGCASGGTSGGIAGSISSGNVGGFTFKPSTAGNYVVAIDSTDPTIAGAFTLTVNEVVTPTNGTCSTAKALTLSGSPAKATESGDTSGAINEFATSVDCGTSDPFEGPQVYYKMTAASGKSYKISLSPMFDGSVYTFPVSAACAAAAIDTACASGGTTGAILEDVAAGGTGGMVFKPTTAGDYVIAVDSKDASDAGTFDLTVSEWTAPPNGVCLAPKTLTLTTSPVTETGDTTGVANQFGKNISCDSYADFDGPQLYYKVTLQGGKTYKIEATPGSSYDVALYAFTDLTCTEATIEAQCTNHVSDDGFEGDVETLTIAPSATTDYIIAIDSYTTDPEGSGPFTLKISW